MLDEPWRIVLEKAPRGPDPDEPHPEGHDGDDHSGEHRREEPKASRAGNVTGSGAAREKREQTGGENRAARGAPHGLRAHERARGDEARRDCETGRAFVAPALVRVERARKEISRAHGIEGRLLLVVEDDVGGIVGESGSERGESTQRARRRRGLFAVSSREDEEPETRPARARRRGDRRRRSGRRGRGARVARTSAVAGTTDRNLGRGPAPGSSERRSSGTSRRARRGHPPRPWGGRRASRSTGMQRDETDSSCRDRGRGEREAREQGGDRNPSREGRDDDSIGPPGSRSQLALATAALRGA